MAATREVPSGSLSYPGINDRFWWSSLDRVRLAHKGYTYFSALEAASEDTVREAMRAATEGLDP